MEKLQFIDSGRFTTRDSFLNKNPNEVLHIDCTDVVEYKDGVFIQVLKTGIFYIEDNYSGSSLYEAEDKMWEMLEKLKEKFTI